MVVYLYKREQASDDNVLKKCNICTSESESLREQLPESFTGVILDVYETFHLDWSTDRAVQGAHIGRVYILPGTAGGKGNRRRLRSTWSGSSGSWCPWRGPGWWGPCSWDHCQQLLSVRLDETGRTETDTTHHFYFSHWQIVLVMVYVQPSPSEIFWSKPREKFPITVNGQRKSVNINMIK